MTFSYCYCLKYFDYFLKLVVFVEILYVKHYQFITTIVNATTITIEYYLQIILAIIQYYFYDSDYYHVS